MDRFDITDPARAYFKCMGLTYSDIKEQNLVQLNLLIAKRLVYDNSIGTLIPASIINRSNKKDLKFCKKTGLFLEGYLYCDSHYFTRRESISFNKNGFIGFAGWADENSLRPLVEGFMEWVDYMHEMKYNKKKEDCISNLLLHG